MESCAFVRAMLNPSASVCNFSFMSTNWHPNPCSRPPKVYQDLRTLCDWPLHKVIVRLVWVQPVRLKGFSKVTFRYFVSFVDGLEQGLGH